VLKNNEEWLPNDVTCVDVVAIERARIISPSGDSRDRWLDRDGVSVDFMYDRKQGCT